MIERIGIIGGGQLGRMLTQAATPMGFEVGVTDPVQNCPAARVGARQIIASLQDLSAIEHLAQGSDVLTWEIEHIPASFLIHLSEYKGINVQPSPYSLRVIQDKVEQKKLLQLHDIPVAPFVAIIDDYAQLDGSKYVVKQRRSGYDGRGNLQVDGRLDIAGIETYFADRSNGPAGLYVEQSIPFVKELSVITARSMYGNTVTYPVVETEHQNNICHTVKAPADIDEDIRDKALLVARKTMTVLRGAGVFAIEMFLTEDGDILVNEIAPRVHNSGHLTIEACFTSQFENHIRAITGKPITSADMRTQAAVMVNILGRRNEPLRFDGVEEAQQLPNTFVHFYDKDPRPERKIGHITVLADTTVEALVIANQARELIEV